LNSHRKGLSLLEIVVSMALFVVTITVTIFVMQAVLEASRRSEQLEQVQERMLVTLEDLSSTCRQANVWLTPAPGDGSEKSVLEFEVPDRRRDEERWPFPVPPPPTTVTALWNPRAAARQVRLRFSVAGAALLRRVGNADQTWSRGVQELRVQRRSPMWLRLTLRYATSRGAKEVSGLVLLPLQRSWAP
jgi:type II secretory pathway component PulJ